MLSMDAPKLNRFLSTSAYEIRSKWNSPLFAFASLSFRPRCVKFYQISRVKLCRFLLLSCQSSITCPSPPHRIRAESLLTVCRLYILYFWEIFEASHCLAPNPWSIVTRSGWIPNQIVIELGLQLSLPKDVPTEHPWQIYHDLEANEAALRYGKDEIQVLKVSPFGLLDKEED